MSDPMVFDDLEPITVPVTIKGKPYSLKEASEAAAAKFKNSVSRTTVINGDGRRYEADGFHDNQALLVSLCLFEVYGDGKERPVLLSTVQSWPTKVVEKIFKRAQEISFKTEDPDPNESGAGQNNTTTITH